MVVNQQAFWTMCHNSTWCQADHNNLAHLNHSFIVSHYFSRLIFQKLWIWDGLKKLDVILTIHRILFFSH